VLKGVSFFIPGEAAWFSYWFADELLRIHLYLQLCLLPAKCAYIELTENDASIMAQMSELRQWFIQQHRSVPCKLICCFDLSFIWIRLTGFYDVS
jgi:hypothetical protein